MFIREIRGYAVRSRRPISIRLYNDSSPNLRRRDGRVAEGARLESVFRGNSNVGSNPTLSAILLAHLICLIQLKLTSPRQGLDSYCRLRVVELFGNITEARTTIAN